MSLVRRIRHELLVWVGFRGVCLQKFGEGA